jgi:hypothetical protein
MARPNRALREYSSAPILLAPAGYSLRSLARKRGKRGTAPRFPAGRRAYAPVRALPSAHSSLRSDQM